MPDSNRTRSETRPLIFGEVLYDRFPDGSAILGGAPFNVAWHLHGLGLAPVFISRVGRDAAGDAVVESMRRWGMDTNGLQRDPVRPTGEVRVEFRDGEPHYDILPGSAYDAIEAGPALALAGRATPLLYHGTLGARSEPARGTLQALIRACPGARFIDVNLRPPWWDRESAHALIRGATWVKLNRDELTALAPPGGPVEDQARNLRLELALARVIVTLGADGAFLVDDAGIHRVPPQPVTRAVDTVGAGDAFSAITLWGALGGWPAERILSAATEFAAAVCLQRGATALEADLYRRCLERWGP